MVTEDGLAYAFFQHRRHFSTAVCEGYIYAVGGWYLDSLVTPDSSTGVYTAVERYDPWTDSWTFVSSLPLSDFQFTLSLSHDSPLTTSLGTNLYVLGNIQRTGEKLVLRYDTTKGMVVIKSDLYHLIKCLGLFIIYNIVMQWHSG